MSGATTSARAVGGRRWGGRAALVAVALAAGAAAWTGGRAALADALTLRARWQVDQWQGGARIDAGVWNSTRESLRSGLGFAPDSPQLNDYLALLYDVRGAAVLAVDADLAAAFFGQGLEYHRTAARLRPMSPHAWAGVAMAAHYGRGRDDELWFAFDRAVAYGPNEPAVQRILTDLACARWQTLSPSRREVIRQFLVRAPDPQRQALLAIAARHKVEGLAPSSGKAAG